MKDFGKKVYQFIFPLLMVWIIVFYLRILNYLNHHDLVGDWILLILFIPVIFYEAWSSKFFSQEKSLRFWPVFLKEKIFLWSRILFWFLLFLVWVLIMPSKPNTLKWLEFFNFSIVPMSGMVYAAESYFTFIALISWLLIYYLITVKRKILIISTSLFLPVLLTYGLFYHFYFLGGIGESSPFSISQQDGVEIFYSKDDFPKLDYFHYQSWILVDRFFPRDIYVDSKQNALYVNYASTYGESSAHKTPNILRIDLNTKETKYFVGYYARTIGVTPTTILASPWFERAIYELSKKDLSLIRKIPSQNNIYPWEIIDIFVDNKSKNIYMTNDMTPALFKYDYETGKLIGELQPKNFHYGGTLWNLQLSEKTKMIYVAGFGNNADILEIDSETFEIKRKLDLVRYGGSSLIIDDENDLLYFQDGGTNKLFEIDIETFKVKRILKAETHARRIHIDRQRKCLYILSYYYGRFFALDIESGRRLWTIRVGGKPYGLAINNDTAYVCSRAGIVKIELKTIWDNINK